MFFLIILFAISIILESSVTTVPLVLILLINFAVATKKSSSFFIAFFCGLILDSLTGNHLGASSAFYLIVLAIVFLYERKFDIQTFPFIFISSFLAGFSYLVFFSSRFIIWQSFVGAGIGVLLFFLIIAADRFNIRSKSISLEYER